jgi:hypothetical protein
MLALRVPAGGFARRGARVDIVTDLSLERIACGG